MQPQNVFALNGRYYDVMITKLKRNFAVTDNEENAGRLTNGLMERDIIGTYYNYSLEIIPRQLLPEEYNGLYDLISSPVDSITIDVTLDAFRQTFDAYVTGGADEFRLIDGKPVWRGLSVNFIAMEPQRRPA